MLYKGFIEEFVKYFECFNCSVIGCLWFDEYCKYYYLKNWG